MTAMNRGPVDETATRDLLDYWFDGDTTDAAQMRALMRRWFSGSAAHDAELAARFGDLAASAASGRLDHLADDPRGRLALILLLDQLPRNLHRGKPAAFAGDAKALAHCLDGIERRQDTGLLPAERIFFLMPLQHAEQREMQALSLRVFGELATLPAPPPLAAALRDCADYAVAHRDIVERFGRFPHRNRALGRQSTDEEIAFLASGGPSFGQ